MRQAELEIAVPRDRKPVDPAHGGPGGPDLDEITVVLFHVQLFHQIGPVQAGFKGLFKVRPLDEDGLAHGGHRGGFDHHVAHERELERELTLILGHAGTEVHQPGQSFAAEGQQARLVDDPGDADEPGADVGGGALHGFGHVRLDLEELGEAVVVGQQGFVQFFVADEDDLEIKGHGLRLDAFGAYGPVRHVSGLLKASGTGPQRP